MYGPVRDMFHINYSPKDILSSFIRGNLQVTTDEITDFEQRLSNTDRSEVKLIEEASFEELLSLCKDEIDELGGKDESAPGLQAGKGSKNVQKVMESLKEKEKKLLGLDREIQRCGFLVFEDRISKLKMMNTPLFLFGMKLFRQTGHLEFFDADFCNTIIIK